MNPHRPESPVDPRLPDEAEIAALYRQLPGEEPPAALDAAILAAAREAVVPAPRRIPWSLRKSFAAAAVLVLVAGLGWRLLLPAPPATTSTGIESTVQEPVEATAPAIAAPAESAHRAAEPAAAADETAPAPPAAPKVAAPARSTADSARAMQADAALDAMRERSLMRAPAPPPAAAPAPAPEADAMERAASAPRPAYPRQAVRSPEAWLGEIEALVADGHLAAARDELIAFRKAWPEHPLPAPLQAILDAAAEEQPAG